MMDKALCILGRGNGKFLSWQKHFLEFMMNNPDAVIIFPRHSGLTDCVIDEIYTRAITEAKGVVFTNEERE